MYTGLSRESGPGMWICRLSSSLELSSQNVPWTPGLLPARPLPATLLSAPTIKCFRPQYKPFQVPHKGRQSADPALKRCRRRQPPQERLLAPSSHPSAKMPVLESAFRTDGDLRKVLTRFLIRGREVSIFLAEHASVLTSRHTTTETISYSH